MLIYYAFIDSFVEDFVGSIKWVFERQQTPNNLFIIVIN
jgi:hypothetical protein